MFLGGKEQRTIRAKRTFHKDEFVVEYRGKLIKGAAAIAKIRPEAGNFLMEFTWNGQKWAIDAASEEKAWKGRLINHSIQMANLRKHVEEVDGAPRVVFIAAVEIAEGNELFYDYGDRSKRSLEAFPFLAV